jgi:hypothetical protein
MGNNRGFREKVDGLKSADASLCAEATTVTRGGVVKLGVGKSFWSWVYAKVQLQGRGE